MKGIIVDIKGKYAVAMTKDGSFVKIKAHSSFVVGCEADFNTAPQINTGLMLRVSSIAAAFVVAFGVGWGVYGMPYSYVNIDINPSIQLTSNLFDRIIRVEGLNTDGAKLLASRHLNNRKLEDGMAEILDEAIEEGYLKDGEVNTVVVSVSSKNENRSAALEKNLKIRAEAEFVSDKLDSVVMAENYSMERLEKAKKLGISPGKLSLIEKLIVQNPEMTVEGLKDKSVKEIMKALKLEKAESKENGSASDVDSNVNGTGNEKDNNGKSDKNNQKDTETKSNKNGNSNNNNKSSVEDGSVISATPTAAAEKANKENNGNNGKVQEQKAIEEKKDNANSNNNNSSSNNNGKSEKTGDTASVTESQSTGTVETSTSSDNSNGNGKGKSKKEDKSTSDNSTSKEEDTTTSTVDSSTSNTNAADSTASVASETAKDNTNNGNSGTNNGNSSTNNGNSSTNNGNNKNK